MIPKSDLVCPHLGFYNLAATRGATYGGGPCLVGPTIITEGE
jgi:hypothetical protein